MGYGLAMQREPSKTSGLMLGEWLNAVANRRPWKSRPKPGVLPPLTKRTLRRWAATMSCLLCVLMSSPGYAAFEFNDSSWEGTLDLLDLARSRLGPERVQLVATLDWSSLSPKDGVLVLHPEVELDYTEASAFMREGGRMAVVDDHGKGADFLKHFQIERESAPLQPSLMLRQNPNLAIALPVVQQVAGSEQGRHPIVGEVNQLVTNHPSALRHPNLTPILSIPSASGPDATLAVTGIIAERGRLFAMGDPSAFINLMLRYPGNRACAEGLIDYLTENDTWGEREGKLYLVANRFKQTGNYGGETTWLKEAQNYLSGLRELLQDTREEGLPEWLALVLGGVITLGGVIWMSSVSSRPYRRERPRYTRGAPLVAQGGVAGRAAVLAAPTTHRALTLLELKAGLLEYCGERLGLAPPLGASELVYALEAKGVTPKLIAELKQYFAQLARVETAVVTSHPIRVTPNQVKKMHDEVTHLLKEIEDQLGRAA